ncbi:hypothetical protein GCM10011321_18470 [Youhaiella tibetensis]|uniref:SH3 domain-containing protein n=1 Tax=Paradevosia tibetensis TaxID=1447062 RepID=A0A5B9DLG6_9HYPH|nr:SH3 domain-containing protein [Youhaiella tibetensis]QEE20074.1 SH3 domain-containing protein [Youhaiella tibetensis]GGF27364.1 hypothetical protein GCM10011321_18470 [Youhaiella tibetensis]
MMPLKVLRSLLLAVALGSGLGGIGVALAIEPFVIVPDTPGGGGGGGGAMRGNAVATANVNVRQGPGTNHRVVDVLQRGESVHIVRCQNNWCLIDHRGPSGWVSANYLREVVDTGRPGGGGGPIGGPIGGGGSNRLVCFFEGADFRGPNFCARPGESDRNLGAWGRRIMSIRIDGRAAVDVCTQRNFGNCSTFRSDVRVLNRMLQNNVGSFYVHR